MLKKCSTGKKTFEVVHNKTNKKYALVVSKIQWNSPNFRTLLKYKLLKFHLKKHLHIKGKNSLGKPLPLYVEF